MIHPSASVWLDAINRPSPAWLRALGPHYGPAGMPETSRTLLRGALQKFLVRFGDTAVRVFRAPGRVNLRGMHVDTHGGYLNLMSHQREVIVAFSPNAPGRYELSNADPGRADVTFNTESQREALLSHPWEAFISKPLAQPLPGHAGEWANYVIGAALRAEWGARAPLMGMRAVVAGNIPPGAALSSSAALCVAAYGAVCAQNGRQPDPAAWILAARDAEWYTGARTGTSDQAASVLCSPGEICNVALLAEDFSLDGLRRVPFPAGYTLLVINSFTRRSLSGAQKTAYTKNRFAYSMALEVFRREWPDRDEAAQFDRLSNVMVTGPDRLARVYETLLRVPARISLNDLKSRYSLDDLDAQYQRYFGDVRPDVAPAEFNLLGPLLYGLSESERAREFADLIEAGDMARAGRYMSTGHDGDRVTASPRDTKSVLRRAMAAQTPLTELSGDYGASSPALDALVDAAQCGGALGACLTGAGIAGCIIALCREDAQDAVRREVWNVLDGLRLSEVQKAEAILENQSTGGAGELPWPV